jgi:hypothetical protein
MTKELANIVVVIGLGLLLTIYTAVALIQVFMLVYQSLFGA